MGEAEHWAFDNISVIQDLDIIDRRRRIMAPAQARHDAVQEAEVKARFAFSFAEEADRMVFDGPSVLIAGRQDSIGGYRDALDMLPRFPHATLAVLDTAGHGLCF